jgi:hypothetical protein
MAIVTPERVATNSLSARRTIDESQALDHVPCSVVVLSDRHLYRKNRGTTATLLGCSPESNPQMCGYGKSTTG